MSKEFTSLGRIGRGYFGNVYACRNNTDGLEYAIKVSKDRIRNVSDKEHYL